ncbi:hypothetical protein V6N12_036869 [Hibiscus sabdariffa]|uniref:DUF4283 domain-containing protein n=1 Tax=Hibiscus sabdariffa TaxID=183260 RepID=A0ABR2BVB6_9ROSI
MPTRLKVSFARCDTRDSFWRRKKGSLPRLPDPPSHFSAPIFDRDATLRAEGPLGCQSRRVDGVIDEEKLSVLETCALGWVKEAVSMRDVLSTWFGRLEEWSASVEYVSRRAWLSFSGLPIHLWSEGSFRSIAGLWGKYLQVDAATEEPTSFERVRILIETSVRGQIDEVVEVASLGTMFSIVVQEAELVGDDLPHWHANQLWEIESARKGRGASMVVGGASDRVVYDRRGVCSEGDADFTFTGIRSWERLDIVQPLVSIVERDFLGVKVVGDCESAEKYGRVVGVNREGAPSTAVLGLAGASAAPVIGSAHGSARKVKSVDTLVEALGSPT